MNLAALIESHPDAAVALRHDGRTITYGELRKRVAILRRELVARGVGPGDRVALVIPTTPAFVSAYFAVLGVGAAAVPLNPESPLAELASELGTVRAAAVLLGGSRAERVRGPIADLGYPVVEIGADGLPADRAPNNGGPEDGGPEDGGPIVERSVDDAAVLLFTSGTAGLPKAAILTHGSLRANIDQMSLAVGLAVSADDVGLLVVPPFHIYGLNAVLGAAPVRRRPARPHGAVRCRVPTRNDRPRAGDRPSRRPPVVHRPVGRRLGHRRGAGCRAQSPCPVRHRSSPEVAERFEERFGVRIWQAYGLTEASPTVTFPDMNAPGTRRPVGVPLPGIEVEIVDADGDRRGARRPRARYSSGAPIVFAGYFEDACGDESSS